MDECAFVHISDKSSKREVRGNGYFFGGSKRNVQQPKSTAQPPARTFARNSFATW
jgi:hypothetical protein